MPAALRDITLSATESSWRLFMVRRRDPGFKKFQQRVFYRDNHTCQFCGFRSSLHQEVINIDGNYRHNPLDNLATACQFCSQCFFLEMIGKSDFGGGSLIYLPEMSQGELNALCHVLFATMTTDSSYAKRAKSIYRSLRLRSQIVEDKLGEGMSNPALYGHLLIDSDSQHKQAVSAELGAKLRVLPSMTRFAEPIESWVVNALDALAY